MQSSLPTEPADQNIKVVDPAIFAEIAKFVGPAFPGGIGGPRGVLGVAGPFI